MSTEDLKAHLQELKILIDERLRQMNRNASRDVDALKYQNNLDRGAWDGYRPKN